MTQCKSNSFSFIVSATITYSVHIQTLCYKLTLQTGAELLQA